MIKKILRLWSVIFMLVMNTLSATLPLNSVTTKQLSDNLFTSITPAGFTFGIWSVIYLWIIIITILLLANKIFFSNKAYIYFIISSVLNWLWIVAWHYGNLHLSILIIVWLLISLIFLDQDNKKHAEKWIRNIFLIYFGWVMVATLLMTMIYLQYQLSIINLSNTIIFGLVAIVLASCINFVILYKERNIWTSVVCIRALYWITNSQSDIYIINTAYLFIFLLWIWICSKLAYDYQNKIL